MPTLRSTAAARCHCRRRRATSHGCSMASSHSRCRARVSSSREEYAAHAASSSPWKRPFSSCSFFTFDCLLAMHQDHQDLTWGLTGLNILSNSTCRSVAASPWSSGGAIALLDRVGCGWEGVGRESEFEICCSSWLSPDRGSCSQSSEDVAVFLSDGTELCSQTTSSSVVPSRPNK